MKFPKLTIENFLTIGEAEIALADRGLVLIQGINKDDTSAVSNGAGKSSIADAVCWCLYGTTARGESGDAVVNEVAGKDCLVSMQIEDDAELYTATRHRKHKVGKNSLQLFRWNGKSWDDLTKGKDTLTQEALDKILDRSYDVFRNALYAGQDQMPNLPGMTDKQLKMLVEEAAGTVILEQAYLEARNRFAMAKDKNTLHAMKHSRALDARASTKGQALSYAEDMETWTETQQAKIDGKMTRIEELKVEIVAKSAAITAAGDGAKLRSDLKDCDAAIASISKERVEERKIEAEVNSAAGKTSVGKTNLSSLKARHDAQKVACEKITERVGEPCDECGKPYCEHDLEDALKIAKTKLSEIAKQFNAERAVVETLIDAHKSVTERLETFRAGMTDLTEQNALRTSLDAQIRAIVALESQKLNLVVQAKALVLEVGELKKEANPYKTRIAECETMIEAANLAIAASEAEAVGLEKALKITETVVEVFGPKGVRAHILDEVTPYLNDQTAKYLGTLSDGNLSATWSTLTKSKAGDLKEKFAIEVANATGGSSFGLISGGEKRKVRIAAALALQDLVATRSSKPIDLFIGDEIDDALDVAGQERLMSILEEKARERGTVMMISHNSLRDWIPQVLTITKVGRVSTIVEEIC